MTYIHTNYNDPSFVPVSSWVRVTHSGEFGQDLELLSARQALTLQGAQQVVAILRGKKLQLGNRLENLMEHLWNTPKSHDLSSYSPCLMAISLNGISMYISIFREVRMIN